MREGYRLRQKICEELSNQEELMQHFITGSFHAYVENMLMEGTWGGALASLWCSVSVVHM